MEFKLFRQYKPKIKALVKKGAMLGYRDYKSNGTNLGRVELVAAGNMEKNQVKGALDGKNQAADHNEAKSPLLINYYQSRSIYCCGAIGPAHCAAVYFTKFKSKKTQKYLRQQNKT